MAKIGRIKIKLIIGIKLTNLNNTECKRYGELDPGGFSKKD